MLCTSDQSHVSRLLGLSPHKLHTFICLFPSSSSWWLLGGGSKLTIVSNKSEKSHITSREKEQDEGKDLNSFRILKLELITAVFSVDYQQSLDKCSCSCLGACNEFGIWGLPGSNSGMKCFLQVGDQVTFYFSPPWGNSCTVMQCHTPFAPTHIHSSSNEHTQVIRQIVC